MRGKTVFFFMMAISLALYAFGSNELSETYGKVCWVLVVAWVTIKILRMDVWWEGHYEHTWYKPLGVAACVAIGFGIPWAASLIHPEVSQFAWGFWWFGPLFGIAALVVISPLQAGE